MIYCENIVDMKPVFYSSRDFETIFFFIFGNAIITIAKKKKFILLFRQWHCCDCLFFILRALYTRTHSIRQVNWAVEFRQSHCRNSTFSLSFFSLLLFPFPYSLSCFLFSLLLFGWISTMPLPKFSLSPHFPNYLWTVRITQINFKFYNINPKDSRKKALFSAKK